MISPFGTGRFSGWDAQHPQPDCGDGPAPPFAAVLEGLPGAEGWAAEDSLQGGEGQDWRMPAAGGRCGWSVSARLGGRSDFTAPSTPSPGARTIPSPPCRVPPGARLFRRIAASAPSGSSRPFPPGDRAASRRELRPLWLAGARPRPSRRAAALPPSSRPPAAGTRVAAYKRGGARASPPLPAAERTGRNGGR